MEVCENVTVVLLVILLTVASLGRVFFEILDDNKGKDEDESK